MMPPKTPHGCCSISSIFSTELITVRSKGHRSLYTKIGLIGNSHFTQRLIKAAHSFFYCIRILGSRQLRCFRNLHDIQTYVSGGPLSKNLSRLSDATQILSAIYTELINFHASRPKYALSPILALYIYSAGS